MKKETLVSIIVPIFNAERYLDKCVRSILRQTYKNIELILVDDGSKDNSSNICKKYTALDERILFIQGENHGVSFSRNIGIENVSGEYVAFIDADDTINKKYIEKLLYNIKDADLSVCGYYEVNSENDIINSNLSGERADELKSSKEFLRDIFRLTYGYQGYVWNKLFKTQIIKDNGIKFDTKIYYNEDRLFVFEYLLKCQKVYYSDEPLYYYFMNNTGTMAARRNNVFDKKMISELEAFDRMLQLLKNKNSYIADEILINAMDSTLVLLKLSNEEKLKQYKYKYLVEILKNSNISKRKKLRFIGKSIEAQVFSGKNYLV